MPSEAGGTPEETVVARVVEPMLVDPSGSVVVVAKVVDPEDTAVELRLVLAADEEEEEAAEEEEEEPAGTEASPLRHDELEYRSEIEERERRKKSVSMISLTRFEYEG